MAGVKLDGAGAQKMKTLEEALVTIQTIHGRVEQMATEVKNQKPAGPLVSTIKRLAGPLQGQLKGQFGMIADIVSAMILATGRGGGDALKVRAMREYIGLMRQSIDIAAAKVKKEHAVEIETAGD